MELNRDFMKATVKNAARAATIAAINAQIGRAHV